MKRIDRIRKALTKVVEQTIDKTLIDEISVDAHENQMGEPSIFVTVAMRTVQDIPELQTQSELTHRLILALEELEDKRFPFLYFDAPDEDAGVEPDLEYAEAFPDKARRR